jgi:hypothetical protein
MVEMKYDAVYIVQEDIGSEVLVKEVFPVGV